MPDRLVVHDYSGHPFQVQLSRELARRGHIVHHQYCSSYVSGRGDMQRRPSDPSTLAITDVRLRRSFARYRPAHRVAQEIEYALRAFVAIRRARPDVVLLCNVPLLANHLLVVLLRATRRPYVFWHQDVYSAAIRDGLEQRLPEPIARPVAAVAEHMERSIARHARRVIAIAPAFSEQYERWGLPEEAFIVIPNWADTAPFTDTVPDRDWLAGHEVRSNVLLYSGTLGMKHDPELLLDLARAVELADATVVVVSEGRGRDWLAARQSTVEPGRLVLLDYLPFDRLPSVLASADLLISILEPAASRFSVPSKALTYLCAGRPVVAVMDPHNAAARMLVDHGAGIVVSHAERERLAGVLRDLLDDPSRLADMGAAARSLAERSFDIATIADRFEAVLSEIPSARHRDAPRAASRHPDSARAHRDGAQVARTAVVRVTDPAPIANSRHEG